MTAHRYQFVGSHKRKREEVKMFRESPEKSEQGPRKVACVQKRKVRAGPALSLSPHTPLFVYFLQQLSGNLSQSTGVHRNEFTTLVWGQIHVCASKSCAFFCVEDRVIITHFDNVQKIF